MPKNKDAAIRYRIIDSILRNKQKPYPSMEDIIDILERKLDTTFSVSTIQKDIKAMKEDEELAYKAPISYSKQHNGYYYTDPNYTMAAVPLTIDDIEAIDFATIILEQFKEVPIFNQYASAVGKIMDAVNIHKTLGDYEEDIIVQFEQVPFQQGSEYLSVLIDAIKNRKIVEFDYKRFDADELKHHKVHPYLLKEYRNRWYLIGMPDSFEAILTFGLDRISNLEKAEEERRLNLSFDPKKYFEYSYGIFTYEGDPEEIILSFTPFYGKYIKTQPLHSSQKILIDDENEFRISLRVFPSPELKMQILGYGKECKVISPETFVNALKESLQETIKQYS